MSATVAAALKKIAVAILSDKKARRTVFTILLVLLLVILMPIFALIGVMNGSIEFDVDELVEAVEENLTLENIRMLTEVENMMEDIEAAMDNAEMPGKADEAQALYIMALYDYADEDDFVERLVDCFEYDQSDAELIDNINDEFGTAIDAEEFTKATSNFRNNHIDYSDYVNPSTKNNLDLTTWAIEACDSGWGYVWGTYGHVLTKSYYEAKLAQYPEGVGNYADFILANWLGKRTADCVGLVKGYCWFDPEAQSIGYAVNGMPDVSTEPMIALCAEQGSMDTMPEIPGLLLWKDGHVGIYIGGGYAIEAMGTKYGVVKTLVSGRGWSKWGKLPCIEYIEETEGTAPTTLPAA